jgi:hypothetical protein
MLHVISLRKFTSAVYGQNTQSLSINTFYKVFTASKKTSINPLVRV